MSRAAAGLANGTPGARRPPPLSAETNERRVARKAQAPAARPTRYTLRLPTGYPPDTLRMPSGDYGWRHATSPLYPRSTHALCSLSLHSPLHGSPPNPPLPQAPPLTAQRVNSKGYRGYRENPLVKKTEACIRARVGYLPPLPSRKSGRQLFELDRYGNSKRSSPRHGDQLQRRHLRGPGQPAPHAGQPARLRAGHPPQHPQRPVLRCALQLDREDRCRADDDAQDGFQLQGRRGFRLLRSRHLRDGDARRRRSSATRRITWWRTPR